MKTKEAIAKFLAYTENRGRSPKTISWYKCMCRNYLAAFPEELPLEPEAIEKFIANSAAGDERRRGYFCTLKAMYNFLAKREKVLSPFSLIEPPKVEKKVKNLPSLEQIKALLECPHKIKYVKPILYLICDCGLRMGEAMGLNREDVFDDHIKIKGKTGARIVPISPNVVAMLRDLKPEDFNVYFRDRYPGKVFQVSQPELTKHIRHVFAKMGIKGSPHLLRHAYITYSNEGLLNLQKVVGHSSLAMTQHYHHERLDVLTADHAKNGLLAQLGKNGDRPQPSEISVESKTVEVNGDRVILNIPASYVINRKITLHIELN